jgi:hypothetical protein
MQQNFVNMTSAVTLGSQNTDVGFDTTPLTNGLFTVEFFANNTCDASGHGEGYAFAGAAVVNGSSGNVNFALGLSVAPGQFITATVTDANGNTSEFSNCVQVSGQVAAINSVEPAAFASGQMITINGSNFNASGVNDVVIKQGATEYPVQYIWSNTATRIIARVTGVPIGPSAVVIKNNGGAQSAPFSVAVQAQDGTPTFHHVFNGTCLSYAYGGDPQNPVNASTGWSGGNLVIVGTGIESGPGTKIVFASTSGGPVIAAAGYRTCGFATGEVAVDVTVPALPSGTYSVTVRSSSGSGPESLDSNAKLLTIAPLTVDAKAGGTANGNHPNPGGTTPVWAAIMQPNKQYSISATGLIDYGGGTTGPNGVGAPSPTDNLAPSLSGVSLVGRINGGAWFQLGTGPIIVSAGGVEALLELAINDSAYNDNTGSFQVTMSPQ